MVDVQMEYTGLDFFMPMETVWGGGGVARVRGEEGKTEFCFEKVERVGVRSSIRTGQIPLLYYVD